MHLRNNSSVVGPNLRPLLLISVFLAGVLLSSPSRLVAQQTPAPQAPSVGQPNQAQDLHPSPLPQDVDPNDPALPMWMRPANPRPSAASSPAPAAGTTGTAGTKPNAANVPSGQQPQGGQQQPQPGQAAISGAGKGNDPYRIRVQSEEVTLQATVMDQKRHLVTSLAPTNFEVYEDGQVQHITSFRREDIPVSIGIVVDNSGSMRTKRAAVTKAVVNLVQASNPNDEVFVVNFSDEPFLDQDFTNKVDLMREALDRVDSHGGTALYDAVIASADHLAKGGKRDKKVLLVVTDGDDNESRESLEQAVRTVQSEKGPTIYSIGILSAEDRKRTAKRALEALSAQTGGVAFFPKDLQEVDEISQEVARDIRNQYTITYKPSNPRANGGYRQIKVVAREPGSKDQLVVRTRSGYFASEPASSAKQ
jgi:Ca-activated chloride channel family protein